MSIEILKLTKCKFCNNGAGRVFLDTHAICDIHENGDDFYTAAVDEITDVVSFNSARPETGPCPHLLQLTLNITRVSMRVLHPRDHEWETSVAWLNPLFGEIDPHNEVGDLRDGLVFGLEHEEFRPKEPHSFNVIEAVWWGFDTSGKPERHFQVEGRAAFARRIPEFMDGLFQNEKLRQEAWRAGRDTRREWAEIKQQREREQEEADLRAERELEAAFGPHP